MTIKWTPRSTTNSRFSLFANYANALYKNPDAVPDDLLEAIATYEKCLTAARRVYGPGHPFPKRWQEGLEFAPE